MLLLLNYRILFENGEKIAAMTGICEQENKMLLDHAEEQLQPLQAVIGKAGQSLRAKVSCMCLLSNVIYISSNPRLWQGPHGMIVAVKHSQWFCACFSDP